MPPSDVAATRKQLTDDVLHNVFSFLDMAGLVAVSGVCHRWEEIVTPFLRKSYLVIPMDSRRQVSSGRWRENLVCASVRWRTKLICR